jgi:hypothetical protein
LFEFPSAETPRSCRFFNRILVIQDIDSSLESLCVVSEVCAFLIAPLAEITYSWIELHCTSKRQSLDF